MSLSMPEEVRCGHCGHTETVEIHRSVNVSQNPDLKDRIRDLSLNRHECGGWGGIDELGDHLLYHDMHRRIMISTSTGGIPNVPRRMGAYTLRAVPDLPTLAEKMALFDDGFDDIAAEVLKLRIRLTLLSAYENLLWMADAVPLEPRRLVYLGQIPATAAEVDTASRPSALAFLLTLDCNPDISLMMVNVPETEYASAAESVAGVEMPVPPGKWLQIDERVAAMVQRGRAEPIQIQVALAPTLAEIFPGVRHRWERHIASTPRQRFRIHKRPWLWTRRRRMFRALKEILSPPSFRV
ncbi:hypothetical protein BH11PLA2_BH11PLA2_38040 [soil metagenome]